MSKLCLRRKIEKHYLGEIITFNMFCSNSTKMLYADNKQLIKLVCNDMKKLMYILICSNGVRSVFDTRSKSFISEIITSNKFCATPHKCYMRINKQFIELVYNDMKNLT